MLKGTLASVSLPGLLQLLCTEGRSGRLQVAAGGRGTARHGAIWLQSGRIVHADCRGAGGSAEGERLEGEEALYALVILDEGELGFEPGATPPARTIQASTDHLMMEAACRRDHARREADAGMDLAAVPVFAPVPDGASTPRFNTLQWRLLAAIDGRKDVTGLAVELGVAPDAAWSMVSELERAGVLRFG